MNKCEKYRQQLLDLAYGEGEETADLRDHIENCVECADYLGELQMVQNRLNEFDPPMDSGYLMVKKVMRHAYESRERKRLILDLSKFVSIMITVFLLYYLLYRWQGFQGLIVVQLIFFILLPLSIIPLTRMQIEKRR